MGRKRIPATVHVLRGTFQPCRHGDREGPPMLPAAQLEAPDWLPEIAKAEWARVVKVLEPAQVLTEGDLVLMVVYCGLFADVQGMLAQSLPVDPPRAAQLRLAAAELGLTPAGRARLHVPRSARENPFKAFDDPDRESRK